ncbi:hypothetical protein [uncultured Fibrobacter sp.]|nr:hypothetical protein [uncultured Fibrobacter sp.]
MVEREDKIESKKEYIAPQMEVMALEVVRFLCGSDEGVVCVDGSEGC